MPHFSCWALKSPSVSFLSSMSFPSSLLSAMVAALGCFPHPTQWAARGRSMLEIEFPSSTSGNSSSDFPLLSALRVEVLGGQIGLLKWRSLCIRSVWVEERGWEGGAAFSRRESVTAALGTHPRTFPICPTPAPFHCTLNSS